jgi:ADP-ribose pyrophosphatase
VLLPAGLPRPPPNPPRVIVRVARDRTEGSLATGGFLNVRRLELVARTGEGADSSPFRYDVATRASLDAVVMAAHFLADGIRHVFLRSAVRPALALRPIPPPHDGTLWEVPAGLIENLESPADAAARELAEELGFDVDPAALVALGPSAFPAPGIIAETHYFFHVEVDPSLRRAPSGDGSVLERDALVVDVPLADALQHCRTGVIRDAKTELALRRLMEALP